MSAQGQPRLTPEQYLKLERAAEFRSEFYNGRMYAMAGASYRHVIITGNLSGELRNMLKNRPCTVGINDLRLHVGGLYTYPDVAVICGEPQFIDGWKDTLLNPIVLAEILSPSTESYDRGFKFAKYRELESLQEYSLISQVEPRIEIFRRQPTGDWLLSEAVGEDAACRFDSLGCTIPLKEIYAKVAFGGEDAASTRPTPAA